MKSLSHLIVAVILLDLTSTSSYAQLSVTVNQPSQTAIPGATLVISGKIVNEGTTTIFINGDTVSISDIITDDASFLTGVPASLAPGKSFAGTLFRATLRSSLLPGAYIGYFSVLGGADSNAVDSLSSSAVKITVNPHKAIITLGHLKTTYSGLAQGATTTTSPAALQSTSPITVMIRPPPIRVVTLWLGQLITTITKARRAGRW